MNLRVPGMKKSYPNRRTILHRGTEDNHDNSVTVAGVECLPFYENLELYHYAIMLDYFFTCFVLGYLKLGEICKDLVV
jgi:hypothetical protein